MPEKIIEELREASSNGVLTEQLSKTTIDFILSQSTTINSQSEANGLSEVLIKSLEGKIAQALGITSDMDDIAQGVDTRRDAMSDEVYTLILEMRSEIWDLRKSLNP